jgi:hypothetical protein
LVSIARLAGKKGRNMTRIIASAGRLVGMALDLGDWGLGVGIVKTGFGVGGVKTRLWHIA